MCRQDTPLTAIVVKVQAAMPLTDAHKDTQSMAKEIQEAETVAMAAIHRGSYPIVGQPSVRHCTQADNGCVRVEYRVAVPAEKLWDAEEKARAAKLVAGEVRGMPVFGNAIIVTEVLRTLHRMPGESFRTALERCEGYCPSVAALVARKTG